MNDTAIVEQAPPTLIVDLDGTLIRTDLLLECTLMFLKAYPLRFWSLARTLLHGRLSLKMFLAERISIDPSALPYNQDVIEFIKRQRQAGTKKVILASASYQPQVRSIADYLGLFDAYHGSCDTNLKGVQKLSLILDQYGKSAQYIGNSLTDFPIWQSLGTALVVNPSRRMRMKLERADIPTEVVSLRHNSICKALIKALRPHQWAKNILVMLPFLAAHRHMDPTAWLQAITATIAFNFMASCVYVLNDLVDIPADRLHAEKCKRPFAAGILPLWWGAVLIPLLLALTSILAAQLPFGFGAILILYFVVNLGYSLHFKRIHGLDLVLLAGMYTSRMLAGGEATNCRITPWLGAFSIFFFFGLAVVKRFTEISQLKDPKTVGRGYYRQDKEVMLALGVCSSLLSLLVLALYINSPQVSTLYLRPTRLWLLMPIFLFWMVRIWIAAGRGEVLADPVLHALRDKQSYGVALLSFLCIWSAL